MKFALTIIFGLVINMSFAQTFYEEKIIFEEDGKYGVLTHNYGSGEFNTLINPGYDTLIWERKWAYNSYVLGHNGEQVDIIEFQDDSNGYRLLDTLGINHIFEYPKGDYNSELIGVNAKGELFNLSNDFQAIEIDQPIVIRKSDQQYYLVKDKEPIVDQAANRIYHESDFYAFKTGKGWLFFDENGNQLYDQLVDNYRIRNFDGNTWVTVSKENQKGYFDLTGVSSPLQSITTPEAVICPNPYGPAAWKYPLPTFRAFISKGKYGLIDKDDNVVFQAKEKRLIVWTSVRDYIFIQKKKNTWELYENLDGLTLLTEHKFDEIIGYNQNYFVVRKDGITYFMQSDAPEDLYRFEDEDFDWQHQIVMDENGKAGVINAKGKLLIPCKYETLTDSLTGLFETYTNRGLIALDKNGDTLTIEAYEARYPFEFTDSAFCYRKGSKWGIMTANNNGKLPLTSLSKPYRQMNFDVIAHTQLADAYVFEENGKYGLISKNGAILQAAEFESIIHEPSWENESMYLGKKEGKTYVFSSDGTKKMKVEWDIFIEFSDEWGYVFANDEGLQCINQNTLEPIQYFVPDFPAHTVVPYGNYISDLCDHGVVNRHGKFIIPMKYPYVNVEQFGDSTYHAIMVSDKAYNTAMYTISGEALTGFEYKSITQPCRKFDQLYFFERKDGTGYLATWNAITKEITKISKENVINVSAHYKYEENQPIATLSLSNGKKAHLYTDLHIEIVP